MRVPNGGPEGDAEDTVTGRVYCFSCGYDLRGALVGGLCPGCQRSVSDSLRGDGLIADSPEEIRHLSDAANMVYYPAMLLSVLGTITLLAEIIMKRATLLEDITEVFNYAYFAAMLSPTVSLVGIFVLTRRRSPAYWAARYGTPQSMAKIGGLLLAAIVAVGLALYYLGQPAAAMVEVGWFAAPNAIFLRGLGRLMRRIRYKKLGKFLNITSIWAIVLSFATLLVQLLRWGGAKEPELIGPRIALTWITLVAGVTLWFFVLRLIVLCRQSLQRLRR